MDILKCSETIDELSSIAVKCEGKLVNEENTKAALILPFLNMLGYQLILDIEPEYNICSGRVDYYIENRKFNRKSILVECKRLSTRLEDTENELQVERYTRELEPAISILTNGKYYRFYKLVNRQLKLIFTFNILKYTLRELRRLLNYAKENIAYIDEREEIFGKELKDICIDYESLFKSDLKTELYTRVLEELKVDLNTYKSYTGIELICKIQRILGDEPLSISVTLPKTIDEAVNISIYDILKYMSIHDEIEFKSSLFDFNISYNGSLCVLYSGSRISSKCTYKGNFELEEKLEGKVKNFILTDDIENILLSDAINIVFGVRNGRIPDELDNIIRKDVYNNLDDKYIFQSINSIVTLETNMIAFLNTIKQLQSRNWGNMEIG